MRLKLYYSVQNDGDGSAYPKFMESQELVEFDQENMEEGWGESCTGTVTLESDSEIKCLDKIETKESYFIRQYCDTWRPESKKKEKQKFIAKFFPDGLPIFTVVAEKAKGDYSHNRVYVGERLVGDIFKSTDKSGTIFQNYLNTQNNS